MKTLTKTLAALALAAFCTSAYAQDGKMEKKEGKMTKEEGKDMKRHGMKKEGKMVKEEGKEMKDSKEMKMKDKM